MFQKFKKMIRRNLFAVISITITAILLLAFFFATDGINNLGMIISTLRPEWLVLAIACMVIYWLMEGGTLHIFTLHVYRKWRFRDSWDTGMIGLLYSAVTPFSTGGQPMQIYHMKRLGMDTGGATSIIALKTLIYQVGLVAYALVLIVLRLGFFQRNISNFSFLVLFGLAVNSAFIFLLILFSLNRKLTEKFIRGVIWLGAKLHIVKDAQKSIEKTQAQLELFHECIRLDKSFFIMFLKTFATTMIQLTFYFLVPYCIYRSFNFNGEDIITMVAAQAFVYMVSAFIPLPGASGGAEGSFYIFFGMFFTSGTIATAIIIWRIITYYFNILFGCIFSYIATRRVNRKLAATQAGGT